MEGDNLGARERDKDGIKEEKYTNKRWVYEMWLKSVVKNALQ